MPERASETFGPVRRDAGGGAGWAVQLLIVMALVAIGGFAQLARTGRHFPKSG
jgi:hypothetical protein